MRNKKKVHFTSLIKKEYKGDLEKVMFFNPQQGKISPDIVESIDRFGEPRIIIEGNHLRIEVGSFTDVQSLFAFNGDSENAKLIGFMIYTRTDFRNIMILQIAVSEEYSFTGEHRNQKLVIQFITKLRDIGRLLKGLETITLIYKQKDVNISVYRGPR